jgi:Protein chain release factor B
MGDWKEKESGVITLSSGWKLPENELDWQAVRSQGAGGQNVNKVATAVHLRFDIFASSLPESIKLRLMSLSDNRITKDGLIIIKAQSQRTQEGNRREALQRLQQLLEAAWVRPKKRLATRPTKSARRKRMDQKRQRGETKALRKPVKLDD